MSHYTVAVFTDSEGLSLEELLEPYYEGLKVKPYVDRTKEEVLDEINRYCENDEELKANYENLSDKEKIESWTGYDLFDRNGNPLSTYNPNSKWDRYVVGGRWSNMLKTKDGEYVDECLVKDLDLTPNKDGYNAAIRFWELVVEDRPLKDGEEKPFNMYKKEYYIERYGTKENYARIESQFSTYAVVIPDGEWYEPGKMGWFGISCASPEKHREWDENYHKFLEEADPNWIITIVDCHI